MRTIGLVIVGVSTLISLSACSSSGGGSGDGGPVPAESLVVSDIAGLQNLDESSLHEYDRKSGGVFSAIFGGATRTDVLNYLNTRAKYFATQDHVQIGHASAFHPLFQDDGPQVIAMNMGTSIWIDSLVSGRPEWFSISGAAPVSVNSSRVGLVILAGGYQDRIEYQGRTIPLPPIFRQQTLMHEARHSDCTGGISRADIAAIGEASALNDESKYVAAMHTCGHPHVICPSGDYAGMPACDNESWGAYQVGAIFADAYVSESSADSRAWNIAQALAMDSKSRLLVPVTGTPDMSSTGVVGN